MKTRMSRKKEKRLSIIFRTIGAVVTFVVGVIATIEAIPYAKEMRINPDLVGGEVLIVPALLLIYFIGLMTYDEIKSAIKGRR